MDSESLDINTGRYTQHLSDRQVVITPTTLSTHTGAAQELRGVMQRGGFMQRTAKPDTASITTILSQTTGAAAVSSWLTC